MTLATESKSATAAPRVIRELDVLVIGAGIAGLYQLYKLRSEGFNVKAIEAGSNVGGTWYWNRYPGARVDSQAEIYQYWFSKELAEKWQWSERFPAQPETERYLNFVADHCDLRKDIVFDTTVNSAVYDEADKVWIVGTDSGQTYRAKYFVSCAGMLSAPLMTAFPGHETFKGEIYHTARYPKDAKSVAGKRVGVIGTGATGIQVIQTVALEAAHLTVFQRTPQYMIPMRNPKYTDEDRAAHRAQFDEMKARVRKTFVGFDYDFEDGSFHDLTPAQRREVMEKVWADGSLSFWVALFPDIFFDQAANDEVSDFVREKMRARVDDKDLAEKLLPRTYGFGTHRVPLESKYLEVFNRDNVDLVDVKDNPIQSIAETGVVTADGQLHEVDMLILATGFDAGTGALTRMGIRGRGGRSLKEEWGKDIRTTLGLQVHGYPNLFITASPLSPSAAFCNMATCLQQQVDWITDSLVHLRDKGLETMEPTKETEDAWVRHHDETAAATLFANTYSWYMGSNVEGKPRRLLSYIGGVGNYHARCDQIAAAGYSGFSLS
ncbi:MAG: NAD(P)/FAD-dependent oxidoreductase [Rhodospirillales bacterium]